MKGPGTNQGVSFVAMMVGLAVAMVGLVAAGKVFQVHNKAAKGNESKLELLHVKDILLSRFDCAASGVAAGCPAGRIPIRSKSGRNLAPRNKIGSWNVTAACQGGQVVFRATKPGAHPLTGKSYSSMPEATDLFRGRLKGKCSASTGRTRGNFAVGIMWGKNGRVQTKVTNGPDSAIRMLNVNRSATLSSHYRTSRLVGSAGWDQVRGMQCNSGNGYYLASCNSAIDNKGDHQNASTLVTPDEKCLSYKFDSGSSNTQLTIVCVRR